jgi:phosphoglycolate phosphatase
MTALPKAVIFDLDGTLIDSLPDVLTAVNHALLQHGRAPVTAQQLKGMVGEGARVMMEKAFEATGGRIAEELLVSAIATYTAYYRDLPVREDRVYAGTRDTLELLAQSGSLAGICTNKPDRLAHAALTGAGLMPFFPVVVGGDFSYRKPDPRHVLEVLHGLSCTPEDAVFVGDSSHDVQAARAADVPIVMVSWGYAVVTEGVDAIVHSMTDLPAALASAHRSRPARRR